METVFCKYDTHAKCLHGFQTVAYSRPCHFHEAPFTEGSCHTLSRNTQCSNATEINCTHERLVSGHLRMSIQHFALNTANYTQQHYTLCTATRVRMVPPREGREPIPRREGSQYIVPRREGSLTPGREGSLYPGGRGASHPGGRGASHPGSLYPGGRGLSLYPGGRGASHPGSRGAYTQEGGEPHTREGGEPHTREVGEPHTREVGEPIPRREGSLTPRR